jgi:hypothetical protein
MSPEEWMASKNKPATSVSISPEEWLASKKSATRSWSDVPGEAFSNIPSSAGRFAKGMVEPIIHLPSTVAALGKAALSPFETGRAIKEAAIDRYGSMEAVKDTLATDPIGALADISTIFTGGGMGAVKAASMASKGGRMADALRRTGEVATKVGDYTNPVNLVTKPLKVAGEAIKVTKAAIQPFSVSGRNEIIANLLRNLSGNDPAVANRLANAQEIIPGSMPTVGQASGSAGLASLERGLRNDQSTGMTNDFSARDISNNQAVLDAIQPMSGNGAEIANLSLLRGKVTTPLYEAGKKSKEIIDPTRTINQIDKALTDRSGEPVLAAALNNIRNTLFETYDNVQKHNDIKSVLNDAMKLRMSSADKASLVNVKKIVNDYKNGTIDSDDVIDSFKDITFTSKTANDAFDYARSTIKLPEFVVKQKPKDIYSAITNIKTLIKSQENASIKRELTIVKKSLENSLRNKVPEFREADKLFAQKSIPINQKKIIQSLLDKLQPALSEGGIPTTINASSFAEQLRKGDELAKKITGFKGAKLENILSKEQLDTLENIRLDLQRKQEGSRLGLQAGSSTAQNLSAQNVLNQMPALNALSKTFIGGTPLAGVEKLLGFAYKNADIKTKQLLAEILLNPKEAGKLMQQKFRGPVNTTANILKSFDNPNAKRIALLLTQANKMPRGSNEQEEALSQIEQLQSAK